jgi:hypothetical protein
MTRPAALALIMGTLGLAVSACGDSGTGGAQAVEGPGSHLPDGYALRLDRDNRAPEDFVVEPTDDGVEVHTGPAGILYRPEQVVGADNFTVRARFTEIDAPAGHLEGFGLFVAGQDLDGPSQQYIYFLVRGDGRYLIKQRDGDATRNVSNGWQQSEAVRVAAGHDVANELTIARDENGLHFLCNDTQVAEFPAGRLPSQGIVGVRVNHNLRVRIGNFRVDS